jgi:hypothetical protein
MASFTDIIPQFNPYVQQLPVEAMVQVGMEKQKRYDEGIQKIQSQIDEVGGLDIYKPLHKMYLQSKLNELGNNLKLVAAGDFSNFQLVNSVSGMTSQIVKDPVVQNAVTSTQKIRKEQENIQAAQKAGKSNPNNEDFFYDRFNNWLNDGKVDTPFNEEFIEYTDVDKKLRDLASKLKEDELGIENPFIRDDEGRTIYFYRDPKTGRQITSLNPVENGVAGEKKIDLGMLSVKVKGLPAEKILNNFMDSLDANDIRQLRIDSWAHYRGAGPEKFQADIIKGYTDKKLILSQELVNLNVKIQNPNLSSSEKTVIQAKISDISNTLKNKVLDKEMNEDLQDLETRAGLDDFKYKVYTQKYLTNLSRDLSSRSYIQEIKTNPLEQADMARKKFQFDIQKEANDMYRWRASYSLAVRAENRQQAKDDFEKMKWMTENAPAEFKITPGIVPTEDNLNEQVVLDDIAAAGKKWNEDKVQWAKALYPKDDMTVEQKVQAFDQLAKDYRLNPKMDLTSAQRKYLELNRVTENNITRDINLLSTGRTKTYNAKQKYLNDNVKAASVTAGGITYTGEDLANFNENIAKFTTIRIPDRASGPGTIATTSFDEKGALNFFKTYQGGKFLPIANAYAREKSFFTVLSSDEKKLLAAAKGINLDLNKLRNIEKETFNTHIATFSPKYAAKVASLDLTSKSDLKSINGLLSAKAYQKSVLGAADVKKLGDYDDSIGAIIKKEGTSVNLESRKDGSATLRVTDASGKTYKVPVLPNELAEFFPAATQQSPFEEIKDIILTSPGHTTNSANATGENPANAVNAKYSGFNVPALANSPYAALVRFDIEGDPDNTGDPKTDGYDMIMYVKDPATDLWKVKSVNRGGYVTEGGIIKIWQNMNESAVKEAIKNWK